MGRKPSRDDSESAPGSRSRKITANNSLFLIVDFQEKLVPHIHDHEKILANLVRIGQAAPILKVPLWVTEQYPKGLGRTVPELENHLKKGVRKFEKNTFSCFGSDEFQEEVENLRSTSLIVAGIETHVCVFQTVLNGLDAGMDVHVVADAVGSRDPENTRIALERCLQEGAHVTSTEMVLFELLGKAGTPEFKQIQALIKD